jgi:hypothetical protein
MSASRLVSLIGCVAALFCATAVAQTPRLVKVSVRVEARQFTEMMDDSHVKRIETTVAGALAAELAKPYPIVDWRTDVGADTPVANLTAAVVEHRAAGASAASIPEIRIEWRATRTGQALEMPSVRATTLYRAGTEGRPIDDAGGQFTQALTNAAVTWANSETSQKEFKEQFLPHVLIANQVGTASSRFVVVPLSYQGVKMRKDSTLLVRYRDGTATDPQQKELTLTGAAPRLSAPFSGGTQTHVAKCELGGIDQPEQQRWAMCVAPLIADPPKPVSVYAASYIYHAHPDVEGGLVVEE